MKAHNEWEFVEAGFCQQQLWFILENSKDRYGGRADKSAKKNFCHGIVPDRDGPRTDRYRYLRQVSGLADEAKYLVGIEYV